MLLKERYRLLVSVLCLLVIMTMTWPLMGYANSMSVVFLTYRDAGSVKDTIAPLLSQGSAISIDNNSVIVSAPAVELKKIVRVIKAMDKPRVQLQVSIFRGQYPDKKGVKLVTTDVGVNQSQTIRVEEGQTFVVEEKRLLALTVEGTHYVNNTGETIAGDAITSSSTTVVVNDGVLEPVDDTVVSDAGTGLGELVLSNDTALAAAEVLQRKRQEWIEVPTGLHVRVTRLGKKQARVAASVVSVVDHTGNDSSHNVTERTVSQSVETLSTFALSSWEKLSESMHFTHRPSLNDQRKVYSTHTTDDKQHSVWIKVEVLP
jgi:hypothetical protein